MTIIRPTLPRPEEPHVPAPTAPIVAPVTPPADDVAALKAQLAAAELKASKLESHKAQMDRDAEKTRAKLTKLEESQAAARELLVKAGFIPDSEVDPKSALAKREADSHAATMAALTLRVDLLGHVVASGLTLRDAGDPDFVDFVVGKVQRDTALAELAKTDMGAVVAKLKERGLLRDVASAAPPAPGPAPRPAGGNPQSAPGDEFSGITSWSEVVKMGFTRAAAFEAKHPERAAQLRAEAESHWRTTGRRPLVNPAANVLGDGSGAKTVQTHLAAAQAQAAQQQGKK